MTTKLLSALAIANAIRPVPSEAINVINSFEIMGITLTEKEFEMADYLSKTSPSNYAESIHFLLNEKLLKITAKSIVPIALGKSTTISKRVRYRMRVMKWHQWIQGYYSCHKIECKKDSAKWNRKYYVFVKK